ncbi:hypothetical protein P152DRAFT_461787 [Eremomyces bilateralis CBS 781.70]|uniref:Uncharacterized protein n=1 Tax=Eremomyces bilateralis CBS 781.70 TaxID=1392243 RepID=A0A6G1FTX4_9PEZI|nr:uncharacterized protein P152DRAFT_461787 [Eremomyces bilateralis CBS 781.70]KAF1809142.1 hypothetical protein P152DRAFT_461787 [Eremomyces bilateralis CBS 781.70]
MCVRPTASPLPSRPIPTKRKPTIYARARSAVGHTPYDTPEHAIPIAATSTPSGRVTRVSMEKENRRYQRQDHRGYSVPHRKERDAQRNQAILRRRRQSHTELRIEGSGVTGNSLNEQLCTAQKSTFGDEDT